MLELGAIVVWLTGDLQQLFVERDGTRALPGCLRRPRASVEAPETIRLLLDRRLEFDQRVGRPIGLQQHIAEELARRRERARRYGRLVGGVFGSGRRAQQLDATRPVAFRKGDPRDGDLALDVDLLRPIGVRYRLQRVAKGGELIDVSRRGLEVCPSVPHRARARSA